MTYLTEEAVMQTRGELRAVSHIVLDGGEGRGAAEREHDHAHRQEEVREAVDAPAEHEGPELAHHLDEVQHARHYR